MTYIHQAAREQRLAEAIRARDIANRRIRALTGPALRRMPEDPETLRKIFIVRFGDTPDLQAARLAELEAASQHRRAA